MLDEQKRQELRERAERTVRDNPERAAQVSRMLLEMAEHVHHLTQVSDEFLTNLALGTSGRRWGCSRRRATSSRS